MRTKNSIINLVVALIGQLTGIIISFFARLIFIRLLGSEYLGLNGLFTNILTILSLAELGIGSAIIFSLYKPLAQNNKSVIKSLMNLYKVTYRIIGITIIILGFIFLPFYKYLINDIPQIPYLDLIFLMFVLNTAVSYFFSYKKSLIICDQKRYITIIYKYFYYFLLNFIQIIILLLTKNYLLYLVIQIFFTIIENISLSHKANKLYPYLKEKNIEPLNKDIKKEIKRNISAMMRHKLGGMVVNSTDNILISKFIGLTAVGIYSNYYLIINAFQLIFNQFFSAITSSIGNLGTEDNKAKIKSVFNKVFFLNFLISAITTICLIILFNDFINLWLGKNLLFNFQTVLAIAVCFYLWSMRRSCLAFREALGLFWYDRNKPLIEAIINLVTSIILALNFGVLGIFIGTIISTLTTSLWIEPKVLYNHGFKESATQYFKIFGLYSLITLVIGNILYFLCSLITVTSWLTFFLKAIICFTCSLALLLLVFYKNTNLKYYCNLIKKIFKISTKSKHKTLSL